MLKKSAVLTEPKTAVSKRRKPTVVQILKDAYRIYCRDRATRSALRQVLRGG
ncbi:MAG: hypothetical protein WCP06_12790 [Verrucomicrobiota bacterium]